MAEALTVLVGSTTSGEDWSPPALRSVRTSPVELRSWSDDLRLDLALASLDRTSSWEEFRAAHERALSLGREVIPAVLAELAKPQTPERFDVLLRLLHKWRSAEDVLAISSVPDAGWQLRAALAEALSRYAADAPYPLRSRIASALARLAKDDHDAVRMAAVDAIGLAGLDREPDVAPVLREAAERDPNADVRDEAEEILARSR